MHRCKERGFCCGAGGARMWMEEQIGKRINTERIDEALALSPDTISTACPYCLVMLGDAVAAKKASGDAKDTLEVIDVAQLLVRSVAPVGAALASGAGSAGRRCRRRCRDGRYRCESRPAAPGGPAARRHRDASGPGSSGSLGSG